MLLLDHCAQVQLDDMTNCAVVVGPCEDSVFIRNATDCVVHIGKNTRDAAMCHLRFSNSVDVLRTHSSIAGLFSGTAGPDAGLRTVQVLP